MSSWSWLTARFLRWAWTIAFSMHSKFQMMIMEKLCTNLPHLWEQTAQEKSKANSPIQQHAQWHIVSPKMWLPIVHNSFNYLLPRKCHNPGKVTSVGFDSWPRIWHAEKQIHYTIAISLFIAKPPLWELQGTKAKKPRFSMWLVAIDMIKPTT
jgi:hypothetical protein